MAEQTLGDRSERLADNFDGTEVTEAFSGDDGVSYKTPIGTAIAMDNQTGGATLNTAAGRIVGDSSDNISDNTGLIRSRTVSSATTVAQTDHLGVINVTAESATITWPSGLDIGTRVQIRKIGTDEDESVDVEGAGGVVFTASQETEIPIFGDGGNWIFEQVTSTRVELVGGWDAGSNSDGEWWRYADKKQAVLQNMSSGTTGTETNTIIKSFVDNDYIPIGSEIGSSSDSDITAKFSSRSGSSVTLTATVDGSYLTDRNMRVLITGRWLPLS